jgi:hypothetical protein
MNDASKHHHDERARARAGVVLRALQLLCAASALWALSSCYESTPCGSERCDGVDNDCDGKADEGFVDELGRYTQVEHCGACGLSCERVFPGAEQVQCRGGADGSARC